MKRVVQKFIDELRLQLQQKKVVLTLTEDALDWLAERGYDPLFGARPLARLIQTGIKDVLSDEVLFGRLKNGGCVAVGLQEDRLTFGYSKKR
jgi:ATP-dependent Clp protease ATP-binding subunit ClpA